MKSKQLQWEIGEIFIIPGYNQILINGKEIRVKPRIMNLLNYFLEKEGQILRKEEIIENVWPKRVITENLLIKSISELRNLLDSEFKGKISLETLRNTGYRLNASVKINLMETDAKEEKRHKYSKILFPILLLGCLILLAAWFIYNTDDDKTINSTGPISITTLRGQEISPEISRDGENITFSWRENTRSKFHIYVMSVDNSAPRKLSKSQNAEFNPAWSPNGKEIAFMRRENKSEILLIKRSLIGDDETILFRMKDMRISRGLIWMNNDSLLVFSAYQRESPLRRIYTYIFSTNKIMAMTSPPDNIYGDIFPVEGKQSNELAFIRANSENSILGNIGPVDCQVLLYDLEKNEYTTIAEFDHMLLDLAFDSKTSNFIVFEAEGLGKTNIWSCDQGDKKVRLHQFSNGLPGQFSIDSKGKVYFENWTSGSDILEVELYKDSILRESEFINSTKIDWGLVFANQSDKMAFISNRSGNPQIWVSPTDAPFQAKQITEFNGEYIKSLSLSPDGNKVLLVLSEKNNDQIYLIQSNGTNMQKVTSDEFNYNSPEWSDDEEHFYYSSNKNGNWNIWKRNIEGSYDSIITKNGGYRAIENSVSSEIFFVKKNTDTIYSLEPSGAINHAIYSPSMYANNFVVNGSDLYFLSWENSVCYLKYRNLDLDTTIKIKSYENILPGIPSITQKPGSNKFYISRSKEIGADILAIEISE